MAPYREGAAESAATGGIMTTSQSGPEMRLVVVCYVGRDEGPSSGSCSLNGQQRIRCYPPWRARSDALSGPPLKA
jgi:hypothetical protein